LVSLLLLQIFSNTAIFEYFHIRERQLACNFTRLLLYEKLIVVCRYFNCIDCAYTVNVYKSNVENMARNNLTDQQIEDIKEAFAVFDENRDGKITVDELDRVVRRLDMRPTDSDLRDMIAEVDLDKDGAINLEEFKQLLAPHLREPNDNDIREIFNVFDADHDNFISKEELKTTLQKLGNDPTDEDIDDMIREADKDGDGKINFEEFKAVAIRR